MSVFSLKIFYIIYYYNTKLFKVGFVVQKEKQITQNLITVKNPRDFGFIIIIISNRST